MSTVLHGLFKPIDRAWIAIRRRWVRENQARSRAVKLLRHGTINVDVACNFAGDTCIRTNLVTKMILDHCASGTIVEITTDNLASLETIPFMLPGHGFVHLATVHTGTAWKIYARKEDARKCAS